MKLQPASSHPSVWSFKVSRSWSTMRRGGRWSACCFVANIFFPAPQHAFFLPRGGFCFFLLGQSASTNQLFEEAIEVKDSGPLVSLWLA